MHFVRIIDESGLFIRDDFVEELTELTIETPCPEGFYLPRWNGGKWVEGKAQEEIDAVLAIEPDPTPEERISVLEMLILQMGGII